MPVEIFDEDEFLEKASRASECRVKRAGGIAKVKARTKRYLYTLKVPGDRLDDFLTRLRERCSNIVELD